MRWLRKTLAVARSQTPRRDLLLVLGLLVLGLLEAAWVTGGTLSLALLLVVPLTIPLLWRTSRPSAVAPVVTAAIVVQVPWASLRIFDQTFVGFVCVLLAFYALGRHGRGPWVMPVVVGCALGFAGALGWFDRSPGSFVLALVYVGAAAVTGRMVAERSDLRRLLERQTEALRQDDGVAEVTRVGEVRGQIAGEVQDLVTRRVHGMVVRSVEARRVMPRDIVGAAELVAAVEEDGRAALDEMRTMLGVLRSTDLWGTTTPVPSTGPVEGTRRHRRVPLRWIELVVLAAFVAVFLGESNLSPGGLPLVSLTLSAPLLGFAVGAGLGGTASVVGLGLTLVGVATVNLLVVEGQWGDYAFPSVLVALAWMGGRFLRSQNELVLQSRDGAAALERSVEVRAAAAATEERLRLARDLHDVLAHTLMVMVVQAGAARRSMQRGRAGAEEALRVVEATGREAITELRRLLRLVDPRCEPARDEPDATPGVDDLASLVTRARDAGLTAELLIEGEPAPIPSGIALATYRVAQEAVTNVIRHAEATRVRLTLHYASTELHLEVRDDGRRVPNPVGGSGNGLTGMRERAAIYNGRLVAGPSPDEGYVVSATFPLVASLEGRPA